MFDPQGSIGQDLSTSFDNQFGEQTESYQHDVGKQDIPQLSINDFQTSFYEQNEDIFQHHDPLIKSNQFHCQPLDLHWVKPHYVNGYVREDGTVVEGYIRDGNGNGNGYLRSNPDGIVENNLK